MSKSWRAIAKGKVQGVGFRYTAIELASQLGIQGTVKNMPDGTVEIIAQGDKDLISKFFGELEHKYEAEIVKEQVEAAEKHTTFKITY